MTPDLLNEISLELWIFILFILLILTLLVYVAYSGMWTSIEVSTSEPSYGPISIAYKTSVGPYKAAGEIFTESFCLLPDKEQLGLYYDDPEGTPPDQLRCAVGPILAKGGEKPKTEDMEKMLKNGFKIAHFPKPSYVVTATFPFATTLSIFLGIYRVYPKLRDYIAQRNLCAYPAIEIYKDSDILFIMPLSKQDEFFVSEFQEEEISIATTDIESFSTIDSPAVKDEAGFVIPQSPLDKSGIVSSRRTAEERDRTSTEDESDTNISEIEEIGDNDSDIQERSDVM